MQATAPIGLLGGTFDPVHLGHLHLALSVYYELQLQQVRLLPSYHPLLREQPIASAEQRITMLQLALQDHPGLVLDTREIQRGGPSYTVDTLAELRHELPATPLCFIMSLDQFAQFEKWHRWQDIPNLAHLIIASRPGYPFKPNKTIKTLLKQRQIADPALLTTQPAGYIYLQKIIPLAISATEIRAQLATGATTNCFLPPPVWQYIEQTSLYRTTKRNS